MTRRRLVAVLTTAALLGGIHAATADAAPSPTAAPADVVTGGPNNGCVIIPSLKLVVCIPRF